MENATFKHNLSVFLQEEKDRDDIATRHPPQQQETNPKGSQHLTEFLSY